MIPAVKWTVNAGSGNDRFQVGQVFNSPRKDPFHNGGLAADDQFETTPTTLGYLSYGTQHEVTLNGGTGEDDFTVYSNLASLNLNGNKGNDSVLVRSFVKVNPDDPYAPITTLKAGEGDDYIDYTNNGLVDVDGGAGRDLVKIVGTEFDDDYIIRQGEIVGAGRVTRFADVEEMSINALAGNDTITVEGGWSGPDLHLTGGLGSDTFNVPSAGDQASGIASKVVINGGESEDDLSLKEPVMLAGELNNRTVHGQVTSVDGSDSFTDIYSSWKDPVTGAVNNGFDPKFGQFEYEFIILTRNGRELVMPVERVVGDRVYFSRQWPAGFEPAEGDSYSFRPVNPNNLVVEDTQIDTLNFSDSGSVGSVNGVLTANQIYGFGMGDDSSEYGVFYSETEQVNLHLSQQGNQLTVDSTHSGSTSIYTGAGDDQVAVRSAFGSVLLNTGGGDDEVVVSGYQSTLQGIAANLVVESGQGQDELLVDSRGSSVDETGYLTSDTLTGLSMDAAQTDQQVQILYLSASSGFYRLEVAGQQTADIAYDATAEQIQQALSEILDPNNSQELKPDTRNVDVQTVADGFIITLQGEYSEAHINNVLSSELIGSAELADAVSGIHYYGFEQVELDSGSGNDAVNVRSTRSGTDYYLYTHDGEDRVDISSTANSQLSNQEAADGNLYEIEGNITLDTGAGDNALFVSDFDSTDGDNNVQLSDGLISGLAQADIAYDARGGNFNEGLVIWSSQAADRINISGVEKTGQSITRLYTNGGNDVVTVAGDDVDQPLLEGLPADDNRRLEIMSGTGADVIDASAASLAVRVHSGSGEDIVKGSRSDDVLFGDDDRDVVFGNEGADQIYGETSDATTRSNDVLLGDQGVVTLQTAEGVVIVDSQLTSFRELQANDQIQRLESSGAVAGDDIIDAGDGENFVIAGDGNDTVTTGSGTDHIVGDQGYIEDTASGIQMGTLSPAQGGNDVINSGAESDVIMAGNGSDILNGGDGVDVLIGDHAILITENGNRRFDTIDPLFGDDDQLDGGDGNDLLIGGTGTDQFFGLFDNDAILGNFGQITDSTNFAGFVVSTDPANRELIADMMFELYNFSIYNSQGTGLSPFTDTALSLRPVFTDREVRDLSNEELTEFLRNLPIDQSANGSAGSTAVADNNQAATGNDFTDLDTFLDNLEATAAGNPENTNESVADEQPVNMPQTGSTEEAPSSDNMGDTEQPSTIEKESQQGVDEPTELDNNGDELQKTGALILAVASAKGWRYRERTLSHNSAQAELSQIHKFAAWKRKH